VKKLEIEIPFLIHSHPTWINQASPILKVRKELEKDGIRIKPIYCPNHGGKPENLWPQVTVSKELGKYNKLNEITSQVLKSSPEVVLVHHRTITPMLLKSGIPLFIIENTDAPTLEWSRYHLNRTNITAVIKGSIFSKPNYYNEICCEGMLQGKLIWDTLDNKNKFQSPKLPWKKINLELLEKVEIGYSYGCYPQHEKLIEKNIDYHTYRKYDVCYVGNTHYPRSKIITTHRKNFQQKILSIKNIKKFVSDKRMPYDNYCEILLSSKICISPLGLGVCHRSFEGIYAGCIVLQPYSDYFKTAPNVYQTNVTYIPCKADLSDVEDKIHYILDSWSELEKMRIKARNLFEQTYWKNDGLANFIKNVFMRCISRLRQCK